MFLIMLWCGLGAGQVHRLARNELSNLRLAEEPLDLEQAYWQQLVELGLIAEVRPLPLVEEPFSGFTGERWEACSPLLQRKTPAG
jgi:hypothetical protein